MALLTDSGSRSDVDAATRPRRRAALWTGLLLGATVPMVPAAFFQGGARVALLKVGLVGTLTLLPGWLYAVYLDRRGASLYDEYVLNLFRLQIDDDANLPMPPRHTTYYVRWKRAHDRLFDLLEPGERTADNLYRRRFEGVYGRAAVSTREAIRGAGKASRVETFSPVLLATIVIAVGWVLTLQPELMFDLGILSDVVPAGVPSIPAEALQYAFVGAYAFVVQDLVRRYFVVDLRNTAYVSAVSRIVLVVLIVTVLFLGQEPTPARLAVAFGLGFFPKAALEALQARTVRPLGRWLQRRGVERSLGEIDGIDLWQETRFVELGIEDVQQFATADLVEILLRSRTPTDRLVAWLDRALLLMLLPEEEDDRHTALGQLRRLGIRSATDLVDAYESAMRPRRGCIATAMAMEPCGVHGAIASLKTQRNFGHAAAFRSEREHPRPDWAAPRTVLVDPTEFRPAA